MTTPNQKWVSDISYIWTREGWLYLAVLIDPLRRANGSLDHWLSRLRISRKIIGWATSDRLRRDLALKALQMAILRRRPSAGCIHHSAPSASFGSRQPILRL